MGRSTTLSFVIVVVATLVGGCHPPGPPKADRGDSIPTVGLVGIWEAATDLVFAASMAVDKGGFKAAGPFIPQLERALAEADQSYKAALSQPDVLYLLVDGPIETKMANDATKIRSYGENRPVSLVRTPYPLISIIVGQYYVASGRFGDALKVLDTGLNLPSPFADERVSEARPTFLTERAASLRGLARVPEAMATLDDALSIGWADDPIKARILRMKAVLLIDLAELDAAEELLRASMKIEPANPIAIRELKYISYLRAGGKPRGAAKIIPSVSQPPGQPL